MILFETNIQILYFLKLKFTSNVLLPKGQIFFLVCKIHVNSFTEFAFNTIQVYGVSEWHTIE